MSPDRDRQLLTSELDQIQKELAVLDRILGKQRRIGRDQIQIHAAASCLHSICNGMEKMLETALKTKGHSVKEGPTSHSDLLTAAASLGVISLKKWPSRFVRIWRFAIFTDTRMASFSTTNY